MRVLECPIIVPFRWHTRTMLERVACTLAYLTAVTPLWGNDRGECCVFTSHTAIKGGWKHWGQDGNEMCMKRIPSCMVLQGPNPKSMPIKGEVFPSTSLGGVVHAQGKINSMSAKCNREQKMQARWCRLFPLIQERLRSDLRIVDPQSCSPLFQNWKKNITDHIIPLLWIWWVKSWPHWRQW